MRRGRPPNEPLPDWPALMSLSLAAKYLSMDENTFLTLMARHSVAAAQLGSPLERWRKIDLDRLVAKLPASAPPLGRPAPGDVVPTVRLQDADIERIAARIGTPVSGQIREAVGIRDAAARIGVSRSTIYRLINEGQLHPIRVGHRVLIRRAELDDLVAVAGAVEVQPRERGSAR